MSRHHRRRRYRIRRERRESVRQLRALWALGGVSPFEALLLAEMARMNTLVQHGLTHLFHRLGLQ